MAFAIAGCSAGGASPQGSASGGATGGPSPAGAPSSAPRRITTPDAGAFGASWSPDGSRLAFSRVSAGRNDPDIATIAVDGSDPWILTTDPAKEDLAAWGLPTP